VVVDDLNVKRVAVLPAEANPPLIVDTDTVLTRSVTLELFQPIAGRNPQVVQCLGRVDQAEFAEHGPVELGWEAADCLAAKEPFRVAIAESLDHGG